MRENSFVKRLADLGTLMAVLVLLFPILWIAIASFKPNTEIMSGHLIPRALTLEHYRSILARPNFLLATRNSLIVGLGSAAIATALALPAAYSLARFRYRGRELLGLVILGTQMLPGVSILVPLVVAMRKLSLANSLFGLTITHLTLGLPIAVWLLRGYIEDIPAALEEAALIDGCSRLGAIRWVLLPIIMPAVVAVGTFAFVLSWGEYLLALSLISSTNRKTLPLAMQTLFDPYSFSWGEVMAGGVLIAAPAVLLFLLFRRYLVGGLSAGGVKG